MKAIPADCCFLYQGASNCVVIDDQEAPTAEEIIKFAYENGAKTFTGLCLVSFPLGEPDQTLLSSTQLDTIFADA